jgi:hypothetical protein
MYPIEPIELRSDLVTIKPLDGEHEMRRRDGSWRDSVHYSIFRSEWPDAKDRLGERIAAALG